MGIDSHDYMELQEALQVLWENGLNDRFIYDVRANECEGWYGPRVTAVSDALKVVSQHLPSEA